MEMDTRFLDGAQMVGSRLAKVCIKLAKGTHLASVRILRRGGRATAARQHPVRLLTRIDLVQTTQLYCHVSLAGHFHDAVDVIVGVASLYDDHNVWGWCSGGKGPGRRRKTWRRDHKDLYVRQRRQAAIVFNDAHVVQAGISNGHSDCAEDIEGASI